MSYINFFPGNANAPREINIRSQPAYGGEDVIDLVDAMIRGQTSSAPVEGAKAALEDGEIWGYLGEQHGEAAVQEVLEELHDFL
ncbi:hypothetical protein D3C87_1850870 [compost metagenome]